ncbi:hypothetical protein ES708_28292 [subsurface metagenome]
MGKLRADPKLQRPVFLREWREHKGLKLEQVAEELGITAGALSQTELGKTNYTRPLLEALANLYGCEPGDLIMRNPADTDAVWTLWERAKKVEREQIIGMMKLIVGRTGTDG